MSALQPLHYLLPPAKVSNSQAVLRPKHLHRLPVTKSNLYGWDFVPHASLLSSFSNYNLLVNVYAWVAKCLINKPSVLTKQIDWLSKV